MSSIDVAKRRRFFPVVLVLGAAAALAGFFFILRLEPAIEGEVWPARGAGREPPEADGFDFPVAPPNGRGFFVRQAWRFEGHLGEDWDGAPFDADLGAPIHAVAAGRVSFAADVGGTWGRIVRVSHRYRDCGGTARVVESLYSHLERIEVAEGQIVRRGERLGTLGNSDGAYTAHLHFELRARPGLPLGPGYAEDAAGWLPPSEFIRRHRPGEGGR